MVNLEGARIWEYKEEKTDIEWKIDRFTKTFFWNFIKCIKFLMEEYLAEQMPEKKFCSNVAPSLGSGPRPFTMQNTMSDFPKIYFGL